jgi:6,7-dimethyl-8-ribityllumazine synthase
MSLSEASKVIERLPEGWSKGQLQKAAAQHVRCAVVLRTSWYPEVMRPLASSAREYLTEAGVLATRLHEIEVPGSFELPLAASLAFDGLITRISAKADIVIALGCIVRGGTPHFDYVCSATTQGLTQVQLKHQKALGFGVLTVDNLDQAMARRNKGSEAAQAALFMHLLGCGEAQ